MSHARHAICTLSPLDAALTMRLAKNTTRLKCWSAGPATKPATHLLKTLQKYCACHTERLLTRYERCCYVTKCHACHTKQSCATFETYIQKWPLLQHSPQAWPWGSHTDSGQRLQKGGATSCEHTLNPPTPRVKWEPLLCIREEPKEPGFIHIVHIIHILPNYFQIFQQWTRFTLKAKPKTSFFSKSRGMSSTQRSWAETSIWVEHQKQVSVNKQNKAEWYPKI